MDRLNDILHELGISKVNLAKYLGVSRQMIYNYLELDDINKWPKDKKVLLLNLLGVKSVEEIDHIKVDTDYITAVEERINSLFETNLASDYSDNNNLYSGLGKKQKELLTNIIDLLKVKLDNEKDQNAYDTFRYLYNYLQALDTSKELKYMLAYVSKSVGFTKPLEFAFNEDDQFIFESILFSAMTLYHGGGASKNKLIESHKRFVNQIEHRVEDRLSRTVELNTAKVQALKELGFTEITEKNAAEVLEKIAEIQSRKVIN